VHLLVQLHAHRVKPEPERTECKLTASAPGDLVLAKTLRDGTSRLEIRIEPETANPRTLSYQVRPYWDGKPAEARKSSPFKLDVPPAPGVTHAVRLMRGGDLMTVGLTAAEAAQVEQGVRAWVKSRRDANDSADAAKEAAARAAAPGAETWQAGDPYGYLAGTGKAARLRDGRAVTALAFSRRYYAEDGMSFGAADDAGYVYLTEVRDATPAEAAELEEREARQAARGDLQARARDLAGPGAEVPEDIPAGLRSLPGARIEPARPWSLAFGTEGCRQHLRADEAGGWLWVLTYNGADGDDWSRSNYPPYIAARLPLTPERAALVAELRAEFGEL